MASLSPDTLWIVSTFANAVTLSAMTRVSKLWRRALVERAHAWTHDKRFSFLMRGPDALSSMILFMRAMRFYADTLVYRHGRAWPESGSSQVFEQTRCLIFSGPCDNPRPTLVPCVLPGAPTVVLFGGCPCVPRWFNAAPAAASAIRHLYVDGQESLNAAKKIVCEATHAWVVDAVVRSGDLPSAHTFVFDAREGGSYSGRHRNLVVVLRYGLDASVMRAASILETNDFTVFASHGHVTLFFVITLCAQERDRAAVAYTPYPDEPDVEEKATTLREHADSMGVRLIVAPGIFRRAESGWWDEADSLVAKARSVDRRTRARITRE